MAWSSSAKSAKGQRKVYVVADDGSEKEYSVPRGVHINVQEGERIRAGEQLMDGPLNPHDILAVLGEKELQAYLVNEIQEVYRLQGVTISDKHIEVIVRQMLRWVKIEDVGDTNFLLEQQIDKFRFREENERVIALRRPSCAGRVRCCSASPRPRSPPTAFISAASFQETTRVLTEAAINGLIDDLRGLKENVIVGRLIPAGTGMEYYRNVPAGSGAGSRCRKRPGRDPQGAGGVRTQPGTDAAGGRERSRGAQRRRLKRTKLKTLGKGHKKVLRCLLDHGGSTSVYPPGQRNNRICNVGLP